MNYCEVCGKVYSEEPHVIFRSQASYMVKVPLNIKHLCNEHHRGNEGPHLNRNIDLKYKRELQKKLFSLFTKEHYRTKEISEILEISELEAFKIVKTLKYHEDGYARLDTILRCMGGKLYAD